MALPKRDTKGRFKKKAKAKRARRAAKKAVAKKAPMRRRRHAAKKSPAAPARRRRRHAAKKNPAPARRRRRAAKMNPAPARRRHHAKRKNPARHRRHHAKRNPLSKRFQKRVSRTVAQLKKRRKKAPAKSLRRRALSAQVTRASAMLALSKSRASAKRIRPAIRGLQRAMSMRSNPGFAGFMESAKILLPQAAVGSVGLIGLAMAGKMMSDLITRTKDEKGNETVRDSFKDSAVAPYVPAISTALITGVAYLAADRLAPKYKGAIAIGGMIGAVVQAVMASVNPADPKSLAAQVKGALLPSAGVAGLGEYTTVGSGIFHGVGEYTTVGSGIFHGLGEYTTIGTGADNETEFAADSLRGLDDASQFAPGEGGILSGGIFK